MTRRIDNVIEAKGALILGAGVAGLFTALKLAPMPVTVLSGARAGSAGSSAWAQGGIAAALGPDDDWRAHAADTIAAGARTRLYDATVLKVVGATRVQIALVYVLEYGLLGIATGVIALGAGTLAASLIARQILDTAFVFDARAALWTVAGGGAATLLFGLFGAIAALNSRPAARLRNG